MTAEKPTDSWAAGDRYEPYVGRWSRCVARELLGWLKLPRGLQWLDVGCGTGALSRTILDGAAPRSLQAVDSSAAYLEFARRRIRDPRISFCVADAQALPQADRSLDVAVSGLVLNFLPDKLRALAEMGRVLRRGGTAALYVWDYAGQMQLMRRFWDAAVALDPAAAALDEGRRFPVCKAAALEELFRAGGFTDIDTCAFDVPTVFRDFDDYWTPFLGGQGPAPGYCMSLSPERREALRRRLRETLPAEADGSIPLIARAFAVRGRTRGS